MPHCSQVKRMVEAELERLEVWVGEPHLVPLARQRSTHITKGCSWVAISRKDCVVWLDGTMKKDLIFS